MSGRRNRRRGPGLERQLRQQAMVTPADGSEEYATWVSSAYPVSTRPEITVRCADCFRLTGRKPRIGVLVLTHHTPDKAISAYDGRASGLDGMDRELLGGMPYERDCFHIIGEIGALSLWYFCPRCERRQGHRSVKIVPLDFFEAFFDAMGDESGKRDLVI